MHYCTKVLYDVNSKRIYILTENNLEEFNSKFFRRLFSPSSRFCVPSKCP